jgi:hypothetical protein
MIIILNFESYHIVKVARSFDFFEKKKIREILDYEYAYWRGGFATYSSKQLQTASKQLQTAVGGEETTPDRNRTQSRKPVGSGMASEYANGSEYGSEYRAE